MDDDDDSDEAADEEEEADDEDIPDDETPADAKDEKSGKIEFLWSKYFLLDIFVSILLLDGFIL